MILSAPCGHCGRVIARQKAWHTGKGRFRHKCPHGIWCSGGKALQCGNNISKSCKLCSQATVQKEAKV